MNAPLLAPGQPSTFVDESDALSDASWNGPAGTEVRYSMSVFWDGIADAAIYASQLSCVSITPYDAIPWAGKDRGIVQGYQESAVAYVTRLVQWLDRAPYYGRPAGVMLEALGWVMPAGLTLASMLATPQGSWQLPEIAVVNSPLSAIHGRWWQYNQGTNPMPPGTSTVIPATLTKAFNWDWDGQALWARSWLIIYATGVPWASNTVRKWGSGWKWGDGGAWGFDQPASTFSGLAPIVAARKAAHCWYVNIIVSFDDTLFGPGNTNPDGTWGDGYKVVNRQSVDSRSANARYLSGAQ